MLDVRLFGHVSASFGLGDGAAATRRSLEACGCRVHCVDLKLATHKSLAAAPANANAHVSHQAVSRGMTYSTKRVHSYIDPHVAH